MTVIRVNPESVKGYGRDAQNVFNDMHQSLVDMVNELVAVRYFGPNAVSFKTEVGRAAADFANRLHADMSAMADAVRTATSNIQSSLGGQPITINIDARPITPPTPPSSDSVDLDTDALDGMKPVVTARFASLHAGLDRNLSQLRNTDWEGTAKLNAVDAVSGFTNSARQKCDEAKQQITDYITKQITEAIEADH